MSKTTIIKASSSVATPVILVGGGLMALYLLTLPNKDGATGATGKSGTSFLQDAIIKVVTDPLVQIGTGLAGVPGQIIIDTPKKMITASETSVSDNVFSAQTRSNVSGFLSTDGAGKQFTNPVTYKQYIAEQPLAFRASAGLGNIITNNEAAKYGAYAATETKKGVAAAGIETPEKYNNRFAAAGTFTQLSVAATQAITVPFGGGGLTGWTQGAQSKAKKIPVIGGWF